MKIDEQLRAEYDIDSIAGRLSLRTPQKVSLERLAAICDAINTAKNFDLAASLESVRSLYPTCKDFERTFPSVTFSLATGVGKTRLMGAFITYLYTQRGIKNYFIVAPGKTVYDKLKDDFSNPGNPKYVFKGLSCFAGFPPQIIADDDYRQKRFSFTDSNVRIFIFNIDKFNKDDAKMRQLNEYLGQSFFDQLAGMDDLVLLMDESHHYRAERGATALNDLRPILGLELTATPKTNKGGRERLFKNVVYEYPLSQAIADGYTRTPWALSRKNVDFANLPPEDRDKLMLSDGILSHERTKAALLTYAGQSGKDAVKPFMLVVCKDTEHAKWVEAYIRSSDFRDGKYAAKTIVVHSKQTGAETEENMRLLLEVERSDNPIEIVIHVNMLKEGWDVNNLYTIVPLRTAASAVLREQMVGRGLRLPYGERTGDTAVDSVMLTAHDKFDELLAEAQSGESIFKKGCLIQLTEDDESEESVVSQPNLDFDEHDEAFDNAVRAAGYDVGSAANDARLKIESAIARETAIAMTSKETISLDETSRLEVVKKAVAAVAEDKDVAKFFNPESRLFDGWTESVSKKIVVSTAKKFIPIPRLRITEKGGGDLEFQPFDLDLSPFTQTPTDNALLAKNLQDQSVESEVLEGGKINYDAVRPLHRLVELLQSKPEIDYSSHRGVIVPLLKSLCDHFEAKFGEEGMKNVVMMHRIALADNIYNQMLRHMVRHEGMFVEEIIGTNAVNLPSYYRCNPKNSRDMHNESFDSKRDGAIKGILFTGAKKGVFGQFKVDSLPELIFAKSIDTDPNVKNWLRPAPRQFDLTYSNGKRYEPDFVVETGSDIYLVEIKRRDLVSDPDVIVKKSRAVAYCSLATAWANANGHKPWTHLFIPDDEIKANRTLDDYNKSFVAVRT